MAPENMNAYTKTLEAILKKYPEAKDIYSEVVGGYLNAKRLFTLRLYLLKPIEKEFAIDFIIMIFI